MANHLSRLKRIVNTAFWLVVSLYVSGLLAVRIPIVQSWIGNSVAAMLENRLGTQVAIDRIDVGLFNRIVIDEIELRDQSSKKMLSAKRIAVKLDILELFRGNVEISSAQLFGMRLNTYQQTPDAPPNFRFVLDSLASKDTTDQKPLRLSLRSIIISNGQVVWQRMYKPARRKGLDPDHLHLSGISAHFNIHTLTEDSLNLRINRLSAHECSGLTLKRLELDLAANRHTCIISKANVDFPFTRLSFSPIHLSYDLRDGRIIWPSMLMTGGLVNGSIYPRDFTAILPDWHLPDLFLRLRFHADASSTMVMLRDVRLSTPEHSLSLAGSGSISGSGQGLRWAVRIDDSMISEKLIRILSELPSRKIHIPKEINNLGYLSFRGTIGGGKSLFSLNGEAETNAGSSVLKLSVNRGKVDLDVNTSGLDIGKVFGRQDLGRIEGQITANGLYPSGNRLHAEARISRIVYRGITYSNARAVIDRNGRQVDADLSISDRLVAMDAKGSFTLGKHQSGSLTADVHHIAPVAMGLKSPLPDASYRFHVDVNGHGMDLDDFRGELRVTGFEMHSARKNFRFSDLKVLSGDLDGDRFISLDSDFGRAFVRGHFRLSDIPETFMSLVAERIPTIPGLSPRKHRRDNFFSLQAYMVNSDFLSQFFDIPLSIDEPLSINASIDEPRKQAHLDILAPQFEYDGKKYSQARVNMDTPGDSLRIYLNLRRNRSQSGYLDMAVQAVAADNKLTSRLEFDSKAARSMHGSLFCETRFDKDAHGLSSTIVDIRPSQIWIGDTLWHVSPSTISYNKERLVVDQFTIAHNRQHLIIDGTASARYADSLRIDMNDIDVEYVLNLVNFHSVAFSGNASGRVVAKGLMASPVATADLTVNDFRFETGRMGTLSAHADYDHRRGNIEILADASEPDKSLTHITGYVSPVREELDLNIRADSTNLEFLEKYCGSFLSEVNLRGDGVVRVFGPFSNVNLEGRMLADGTVRVSSLHTTYTLRNTEVTLVPDRIRILRSSLTDRLGQHGWVEGDINHHAFKDLDFDIHLRAQNLLAYDVQGFGDNSFYGTVFATGDCVIKGKEGLVNIDVDARPERGTVFVYNVEQTESVDNDGFIRWKQPYHPGLAVKDTIAADGDIPSDVYLNFLIHSNPDAEVRLIMDKKSGDYINLFGEGVLRASYYNKGSFEIFGNFAVDHGLYKLTIQNLISKEFTFKQGGTITFSGDPYHAALRLNAVNTVNGVSLSPLNIGKSFATNNIRVDCLMEITGTPSSPKVSFNLDMPTINPEAKQMIYSLINSEEEMNQQVLYLLTIGTFYTQGKNNAATENAKERNATSLAMQSILSGTITAQINNVLSNVVNNNNWNFGANISTGDEGWNNAEYEGLLSGRLFNNRLLINGQFGYRDNANATTSFIGDFDIRYLLFPNGNLAVKVYNQTNDRYFVRNSLTTQGIGLIIKKDFENLYDLFGIKSKRIVVPFRPDSISR